MLTPTDDTTATKYWEQAEQWFKDNPWMQTWNTGAGVARAAVAEYIANQNGETLFDPNRK